MKLKEFQLQAMKKYQEVDTDEVTKPEQTSFSATRVLEEFHSQKTTVTVCSECVTVSVIVLNILLSYKTFGSTRESRLES